MKYIFNFNFRIMLKTKIFNKFKKMKNTYLEMKININMINKFFMK